MLCVGQPTHGMVNNHPISHHTSMKVIATILAVLAMGIFSVNAQAPKGEKPRMTPEEAFKKRDTNSDGKIDKAEFTKTKDATKSEGLGKMFDAKDKNKDGSLDLEEFKAGGKGKGKGKGGPPPATPAPAK
jgi:hypothetical protein